ncbi:hypothetical protein ACJ72_02101 [Emergomyces africanus]|uniref:Uncharacterized protein n=1 Tax=Emergomyces africanus TaxID=1955775 RepID=A0A1B7P3C4_9EURO|nr:hypothetical protein ACJ72_02101 [Emergomyces africanus]
MASLRKQEKRKHMGYDSTSFEPSKLRRGNDSDSREASPRARDERDDNRNYRDRREPDGKKFRKEPSNTPRIHHPNPYGKAQSKRDDIAYATGRTAVQPFASRDLDLPAARELKDKIRDIKRLLNRADHLPADVKIEKERALVGYERDLEIVESRKNRAAMIKKYHFVRTKSSDSPTKQTVQTEKDPHRVESKSR